jgi:hypothetical protein
MVTEIHSRCNTVEECYEFMLAYAAQGLSSDDGSQSGKQIREFLQRAVDALSGLADACIAAVKAEGLEPAEKYLAFLSVLDRDACDSLCAIELVLAQPRISSQLIDNLNASMHLRAVLTDLFLLSDMNVPARTIAPIIRPEETHGLVAIACSNESLR